MPTAKAARTPSLYGVHPSVAMVQKSLAELKENTGRSLEEWIALVNREGPKDEKSLRAWLKAKHKLGMNRAGWIAERAEGKGGDLDTPETYLKSAVRYVEEQYPGPKEKLRPIFDELLTLGKSLGKDVKACPCKTIVPLYRNHVFAQVKPTTNSRIDLGLALAKYKGKFPKRIIDTGGVAEKNRIPPPQGNNAPAQIDDEVKKELKKTDEPESLKG